MRNSSLCGALAVCAALFFGCASAPPPAAVDPLALIDRDAALYLYIPAQSHLPLVTKVLARIGGMDEKDAEKIAARAQTIYIAEESTRARTLLQLAATGSFPAAMAKFTLTPRNGWLPQTVAGLSLPYTYYKNTLSQVQVSLPSSANALVSYAVEPQLALYDAALAAPDAGVMPDGFDRAAYEFLTTGNPDDIRFYERKADAFFQDIVGVNLRLPLAAVSGVLEHSKKTDDHYYVTLMLDVAEASATPAKMKALLSSIKIALFGIPAKVTQTGARRITIVDLEISKETLLGTIAW